MVEREEYVQCMRCGKIHRTTIRCDDDDLYILEHCPRCGPKKHLRCGENQEDIYVYYDNTLDKRFYEYKTK